MNALTVSVPVSFLTGDLSLLATTAIQHNPGTTSDRVMAAASFSSEMIDTDLFIARAHFDILSKTCVNTRRDMVYQFFHAYLEQKSTLNLSWSLFKLLYDVYVSRNESRALDRKILQDEVRILHSLYRKEPFGCDKKAFARDFAFIHPILVHAPTEKEVEEKYSNQPSWLRYDTLGKLVLNQGVDPHGTWIEILDSETLMKYLQDDFVCDNNQFEAFCDSLEDIILNCDGLEDLFMRFSAATDDESKSLSKLLDTSSEKKIRKAIIVHPKIFSFIEDTIEWLIGRRQKQLQPFSKCDVGEIVYFSNAIKNLKQLRKNIKKTKNRKVRFNKTVTFATVSPMEIISVEKRELLDIPKNIFPKIPTEYS